MQIPKNIKIMGVNYDVEQVEYISREVNGFRSRGQKKYNFRTDK